jgi:8-oxo-dGTP diphosphatase
MKQDTQGRFMDQPQGTDVRCSAVVFRGREVLLVRRVRDGGGDWVLPGGTPHLDESMAACARRETQEETGLTVEPTRIAFLLETQGPLSGLHTVDLVFLATLPDRGQQLRSTEPGLDPSFVPLDALPRLDLRPPIAGHLRGLYARYPVRTAAYLGNLWRPRHPDDDLPVLLEFAEEPPAH